MHKNGKFIPLIVLGFTFLLSGCDYFADKHLVEELKKTAKRTRSKDRPFRKTTNYAYSGDPKGRRSRWPH